MSLAVHQPPRLPRFTGRLAMSPHHAPGAAPLALAAATDEDFEALLSLRLAAMHESLQRLGRFDPQRARERLSRAFEPAHTRHILMAGERVGFVVVLPRADHLVLPTPWPWAWGAL